MRLKGNAQKTAEGKESFPDVWIGEIIISGLWEQVWAGRLLPLIPAAGARFRQDDRGIHLKAFLFSYMYWRIHNWCWILKVSTQVALTEAQLLRFSCSCEKAVSWDLLVRSAVTGMADLSRAAVWLSWDRLSDHRLLAHCHIALSPSCGLGQFRVSSLPWWHFSWVQMAPTCPLFHREGHVWALFQALCNSQLL